MTWPLRHATAGQIIQLGPFVQYDDDTDQLIPAEVLTITAGDIRLHKSGATTEVGKNSGGATHLAAGRYRTTLDATDTDTLGPLRVAVTIVDALPVWLDCVVLPAAVYDSLHTDTGQGLRAEATNMRGTDGALTAAAYIAPNNSAIAAIKAKTDNLPASPASTADVHINFDPTITVHPTVLSSESVAAIAAPILAAVDRIEIDTVPSVDEIAERLLVAPANKLLTDTNGYVIAANVSEENGQYQISVSVTAGGSGVENVLITIPGTLRRYYTDAFGRTNILADDGTYDLRITPPPGYEPAEDVTVTVNGSDQHVPIELVARPIVIQPPAGTCALTVRVASQSGNELAGIPVTAKLPKGYAVTSDTLNLNTTESQTTDPDGLATLILLRNQPYDLTAKRLDQGAVILRIQTPDAEQATLSQVIQV